MKAFYSLFVASWALVLGFCASAPGAGLLVPEGQYRSPLDITYHCVTVDLDDRHAETHVEQVFHNPTAGALEATYFFPIPRETNISEFAMRMNGERVTGELVESEEACDVYESIVHRVCDPGLLEFIGGRLLRARVFPIPPHGDQRIDLTYSGLLPLDSGMVHYEYPLRTEGRASQVKNDFSITVRIRSPRAIAGIYSPSHPITVERESDRSARVTFERKGAFLGEDFDLYYGTCAEQLGMSVMTHRTAGEDGYFLLLIAPIADPKAETATHPDITFVLDTSASMMEDDKIGQAKRALREGLRGLRPENRFNIVHFNTEVSSFRDSPVPASPETLEAAADCVGSLEPRGQTDIHSALLAALRTEPAADRPHVVVFLTDGKPTVGETNRNRIAQAVSQANQSGSRLFTFGLGSDVDTHLLDLLAQENHGVSEYLKPRAEIERELSAFYRRIRHPVLSEPELAVKGARVFDTYPQRIMDIFAGRELSVVGRYRSHGYAEVVLRGKMEAGVREFRFETVLPEFDAENGFLPRLWAGRKIAHLLDAIRLDGETPTRKREVMALSREYGIMTPYTSYLITEDGTARVAADRTIARPAIDPLDLGGIFPGRFLSGSVTDGGTRGYGMKVEADEAWRSVSGGEAVAIAKNLRGLKEASRIEAAGSGIRVVEGRTFALRDGIWIDEEFGRARDPKVVEIRFLGRAYFELLRRDRSLARYLALGKELIVKCPGGFVKVSETSGADMLPLKTIEALLKAPR